MEYLLVALIAYGLSYFIHGRDSKTEKDINNNKNGGSNKSTNSNLKVN